jgi:hypothetical protein
MSAVPVPANGAHSSPEAILSAASSDDPIALGQIMARSGLFPDIRRVSQAIVKILAGRELGIGPFAAMSDIHIIDGKPVVGARILAALVRASERYDYKVVEWTHERCVLAFSRDGQPLEPLVSFDEDDAKRAGLDRPTRNGRPSNHMRYPRNMKFARAMSNGVALHCPDLTAGTAVYTPDELEVDDPDADTPPAEADTDAELIEDARPAGGDQDGGGVDGAVDPVTARRALTEAALQAGYAPATVVEVARLFCDTGDLQALDAEQALTLTDLVVHGQRHGVTDRVLAELAAKALALPDRAEARERAQRWLLGLRPAA